MSAEGAARGPWSPVLDFLTNRTGLVFGKMQMDGVHSHIQANMRKLSIQLPAAYVERLAIDDLVLDDLVADVTVGETYFFRDPGMFDYLRTQFLPRMGRTMLDDEMLRVWCAGCASGEEAYSVAMLLEDTGWGGRSIVIGTDISRAALMKARRASYGEWSFRSGDRSFMRRYFTSMGSTFTLTPRVRNRVQFQYHNLARDGCPAIGVGMFGVHLILCRNVLMYLDDSAVASIAKQLRHILIEGGVILTGASDPPLQHFGPLSAEQFDEGTVYWKHPSPPAQLTVGKNRRTKGGARAGAASRAGAALPGNVPAMRRRAGDREPEDAPAFMAHVRAVAARSGPVVAGVEAGRGLLLFPLSVELAFLLAVLPAIRGSYAEAAEAARRALYLDRFQPALHFLLATSLWNCGDLAGARRGFRNARDLAAARPEAEVVLYAEGETAGRMAAGASAHLAMVELESAGRA